MSLVGLGTPGLGKRMEVEVEGLVLVNTGANPQAAFRAVVACHTIVNGQAATARDVTGPFPATPQGDSKIEAQVNVPDPCFDPAVFVTTGAGDPPRWFAVTGRSRLESSRGGASRLRPLGIETSRSSAESTCCLALRSR